MLAARYAEISMNEASYAFALLIEQRFYLILSWHSVSARADQRRLDDHFRLGVFSGPH